MHRKTIRVGIRLRHEVVKFFFRQLKTNLLFCFAYPPHQPPTKQNPIKLFLTQSTLLTQLTTMTLLTPMTLWHNKEMRPFCASTVFYAGAREAYRKGS